MIRKVLSALVIASLAFTVSCGSKKKKDGSEVVGGELGASVATRDFDPEGSDSGKIAGLSTINFGYDQASLTTEARRLLAENADWIRGHKNTTIQVEGHCDKRGSVEYNLALGERRAKAVKGYLVSLGVDPKRLTIISYGKEKPVAQGDSEAAFTKNRRANFVPLPQ